MTNLLILLIWQPLQPKTCVKNLLDEAAPLLWAFQSVLTWFCSQLPLSKLLPILIPYRLNCLSLPHVNWLEHCAIMWRCEGSQLNLVMTEMCKVSDGSLLCNNIMLHVCHVFKLQLPELPLSWITDSSAIGSLSLSHCTATPQSIGTGYILNMFNHTTPSPDWFNGSPCAYWVQAFMWGIIPHCHHCTLIALDPGYTIYETTKDSATIQTFFSCFVHW